MLAIARTAVHVNSTYCNTIHCFNKFTPLTKFHGIAINNEIYKILVTGRKSLISLQGPNKQENASPLYSGHVIVSRPPSRQNLKTLLIPEMT